MTANLFHKINDTAEYVLLVLWICVYVQAGASVCVVGTVSYVSLNYWATVRTNLQM